VRILYNYVATRFRYIGISFGIGRYQPHAAVDVLRNEYGDCKDKHTLLASLLQSLGIEAYPALTNSSRHIDPDVPSPGQFDHIITAVPGTPNAGKLIWLDTTTEVAPFAFLAFNLRDKQALVISSSLPPTLITTPPDPPFRSFRRFEIDAKLSDAGVLEGKVEHSYRGDSELLLRALFRQFPQSQWKDLAQGISQGAGFGGEVSEVEVDSPEDTSEPFHFSNQYARKDYPDWANHRITAPVGFVELPEVKDDEDRTQPILLGAREEVTDIAKVELPKGYVPRLLEAVDLVRDFAEYHTSYTFKDGVWVAEVRLLIKQSEVPLSALKDYQSFQKAISDDQNRYTELSSGSAQPYVLSPSSNAEATNLFREAQAVLQLRDLSGASKLLEQALQLDDHYKDAWLGLSSVRLAQGRTDEGLNALRKAIKIDPQDTGTYKMLGYTYLRLRRREEEIQVWQDLLKLDPNDKDAHANLGCTLVDLKRYDEAVPHLEVAVALNKPNDALNMALAKAYLGAGSPGKALARYKEAAAVSLNSWVWNDAAYALADNNLSLPDAQHYAEKAVKSAEDDTVKVRLDELEVADLSRMTQLSSYWDTLGWVYFREGDCAKAEKYLEAAWNLEQGELIGEHLAEAYEKQGKKEAASHQYMLVQGLPESGGSGVLLRRRDESLVPPKHTTALEEVEEMRRTKLGKLSTKQGSAEFFVLLAPGGRVEDVKFISGAEHIRPLSKVLASLTFKAPLPDEAPVKLVRRGVLVCEGANLGCDFTLFTVDSVQSTE